ncbi:hypothetical protein V2J09_006516 [Rumex salicifolius]
MPLLQAQYMMLAVRFLCLFKDQLCSLSRVAGFQRSCRTVLRCKDIKQVSIGLSVLEIHNFLQVEVHPFEQDLLRRQGHELLHILLNVQDTKLRLLAKSSLYTSLNG